MAGRPSCARDWTWCNKWPWSGCARQFSSPQSSTSGRIFLPIINWERRIGKKPTIRKWWKKNKVLWRKWNISGFLMHSRWKSHYVLEYLVFLPPNAKIGMMIGKNHLSSLYLIFFTMNPKLWLFSLNETYVFFVCRISRMVECICACMQFTKKAKQSFSSINWDLRLFCNANMLIDQKLCHAFLLACK